MDWDEQERRRRKRPPEAEPQRRQTGQSRQPRQDRREARPPEPDRRRPREPDRPRRQTEPRREARNPRPPERKPEQKRRPAQKPEQERRPARQPEQRTRRPAADQAAAKETREARRRQAEQKNREAARKRRECARRTPPKALPRRKLLWKLLTTAAVVVALLLGLTIFFKVQNVTVTGNEKYTAERILAASGIEQGENLLTFGKSRAAGRILAELPYVDQVQIGIKLPNTVHIDIVELEVTYAIRSAGGEWWLMDCGGKLLETVEEAEAAKHTQVLGICAEGPTPGGTLVAGEGSNSGTAPTGEETEDQETDLHGSAAERGRAALEILKALEETEHMGDVTTVDVSSLYDIQLWYGKQYQILLGGATELTYKVRYMTQAVGTLADYQSGVLDLTLEQDRKAIFTPW